MQTLSYGDFSSQFHDALRSKGRVPSDGTLEVTRRCNLTCQHCYNNLPVGDREALRSELSFDEITRVMDELSDAGCLWLLLTGGEVFARKDFLDIYDYAIQKGFLVTVFTNATMVTERIADHLASRPPFRIEVTLYGYQRETYERLTRVEGSYDKCMRGIRLLLDRGLPLTLKTVATTITKDEIPDMQAFAEQLGVEFKFDGLINPRIDCSQSPLHVRLSPQELVELDLRDAKRVREFARLADSPPTTPAAPSDEVYSCGGGLTSFAIDPQGKLSICVLSHQEGYDLRLGNFETGWHGFVGEARAKKRRRETKCVRCGIQNLCGMCAANGELHHGDAEKPVDFFCETAHLRAHTFGVAVPEHGDCEYCEAGEDRERVLASAEALRAQLRDTMSRLSAETLPSSATSATSASSGSSASSAGSRRRLPLTAAEGSERATSASGCGSCSSCQPGV